MEELLDHVVLLFYNVVIVSSLFVCLFVCMFVCLLCRWSWRIVSFAREFLCLCIVVVVVVVIIVVVIVHCVAVDVGFNV